MGKYFYFGEEVKGYETRVINEREARASAGIMFLFGFTGFLFVALRNELFITELFSFTFFIEFFIRVLINPKYAPYIILSRFFITNQKPEYVGAPQKRFAWAIGLILGAIMVYLIVHSNLGQLRIAVCFTCLIFLYAESVFGICVGCKMYEVITRNKAQNCPGGVCEMRIKDDVQKISFGQVFIILLFSVSVYAAIPYVEDRVYAVQPSLDDMDKEFQSLEADDCQAPQWAIKIGHEQMWKEHHGCN